MTAPTRLRFAVVEAIRLHRLWTPGQRVAVAVSGGLDSVTLLDLLVATRRLHGGVLSVVTVDHGTRPGSAADARWVQELGRAWGLPVFRADRALGEGASEAACRRARLAVLAAVDAEVVALGHHRDDHVETALIGLIRGGGTRALGGLAWRTGRRVRPLRDTPRDALRAWARARGLDWREDPTNDDPRFLRNRVRHRLLPVVEALRGGAVAGLARGAGWAADDDALLTRLSEEAAREHRAGDGLCASWVAEGPEPLVRRALSARLPSAGAQHLDAVRQAAIRGSGRVDLGNRVVEIRGGVVRVVS